MAKQGLLAQSRPAADTDTILYRAPIDKSASTVLTIANDGSASTFDVAVKDYDQKLTLDASTYKLHEGDVISAYRVALNTAMLTTTDITPGQSITTTDAEKSFKFESFYVPPFTEIFVKSFAIRAITVESITGKFSAGETFTKGSAPNTTTATVYGQNGSVVYIGASTLNGTGTEFAAGDSVSSASGDATISTGGVGTAANDFVFSTTTSGGTYAIKIGTDAENLLTFFDDRTYRFNVSDSTMASKEFILSKTINGEWGPDGTAGNSDDGVEYTTNKTTSGTPGQSGAYVQYAFNGSGVTSNLYFYEGTTGTAANASYGGADRLLTRSTTYEYNEIFIFDKVGTLGNNVDTFTLDGVTYTITGQTAGAYGYVKDYTGTSLKFIKGLNSADWSQSDTFRDVPKLNSANRTTATISSIAVASGAVETSNYIATNHANAANNDEKITSLVVGPGEVVVVNSTTQNNVFSLIGFEDTSDSITIRVHGQS